MSHAEPTRARRRPVTRRVTVSGVLGELLITVGVLLLGFVGWKFWLNDFLIGRVEAGASQVLSRQLAEQHATADPVELDENGVPVRPMPEEEAVPFGVMYVPAWGEDFSRRLATGIDRPTVLDQAFVGAYMDSDPLGAEGNFAVAAHRITYGGAFLDIDRLSLGDRMYFETVDGWYTYEYHSAEYVEPTAVDVLADVPQHPELPASERVLTLISCNPSWSMDERIIVYMTLVEFTPRDDGPPKPIQYAYELRQDSGGQDQGYQ